MLEKKKELRTLAKARRKAAHDRHGTVAGQALALHGFTFASPPDDAVVSGYSAIGDEINGRALLIRAFLEGRRVALPTLDGKGRPLVFRGINPGDATVTGVWGIEEPPPDAEPLDPDLLLVPLLAFDRQGYRLGYGGGFYDRTLARLRSLKPIVAVGLAYDEQEVDAVPHLDYDQRLDWILTPSGPRRCSE